MSANGIVAIESKYSAHETVERIEEALREKGLAIFALFDHSGEAAKIGLSMPFTQVIVFGSPNARTPMMVAAPSVALDLPLKALVQESNGKVLVSFNAPEYLRDRHAVPEDLLKNIAGAGMLMQKAVA